MNKYDLLIGCLDKKINERLEQENEKLEKALEFYVRKEQEGIA